MRSGDVYPSKYLKSEELEEDVTVTIKKVVLEELESKDGRNQEKPIAYFKETEKGMVLNKTNWALVARQHGDESDAWTGKQITLTVMDVEAFGEMVSAIRVKPPRTPKVGGLKNPAPAAPAGQAEDGNDQITQYWTEVNKQGLSRKQGLEILKSQGEDFEKAIKALLAGRHPF